MGQMFQFRGVGQAQITNRPPKFKNRFVGEVEIVRLEVQKTRHGDKFFAGVKILSSNMTDVHPVGQICSWGQKLIDENIAYPALKVFLAAFAGIPLKDEEKLAQLEAHMDALLTEAVANPENNRLVGRRARLETEEIKTGENRDFMRHNWYPV